MQGHHLQPITAVDAVIELREAVATMSPVKPVLDDVEAGLHSAVGISVTFQVGTSP